MNNFKTAIICALLTLFSISVSQAQITDEFNSDLDSPDLDSMTTSSAPRSLGTDATTGFSAHLDLTGIAGGTSLSQNTSGVGVGDANFGPNESMTFHFDVTGDSIGAVFFESLTFKKMTAGTDIFTLSSSDFKDQGYDSLSWDTGISFNETLTNGVFTLERIGGTSSTVDFSFLAAGSKGISVSENTSVTLAFTGTGQASWSGYTIHAVPEPGTVGVLSACFLGFTAYRRRRKKTTSSTTEA